MVLESRRWRLKRHWVIWWGSESVGTERPVLQQGFWWAILVDLSVWINVRMLVRYR